MVRNSGTFKDLCLPELEMENNKDNLTFFQANLKAAMKKPIRLSICLSYKNSPLDSLLFLLHMFTIFGN